jgi:hypothetical protein
MSVKGEIKEAAGFVKEEAHEHGKTAESKAKAQEGRNLRNEAESKTARLPRSPSPVPAARKSEVSSCFGGGLIW